jgi:hypothetical protein
VIQPPSAKRLRVPASCPPQCQPSPILRPLLLSDAAMPNTSALRASPFPEKLLPPVPEYKDVWQPLLPPAPACSDVFVGLQLLQDAGPTATCLREPPLPDQGQLEPAPALDGIPTAPHPHEDVLQEENQALRAGSPSEDETAPARRRGRYMSAATLELVRTTLVLMESAGIGSCGPIVEMTDEILAMCSAVQVKV